MSRLAYFTYLRSSPRMLPQTLCPTISRKRVQDYDLLKACSEVFLQLPEVGLCNAVHENWLRYKLLFKSSVCMWVAILKGLDTLLTPEQDKEWHDLYEATDSFTDGWLSAGNLH